MALFVMLTVAGASCTDRRSQDQATPVNASLDDLFVRLKSTSDAQEAKMIEVAILHAWSTSGKKDVDMLMHEGLKAIHDVEIEAAQAAFDEVVQRAPDFPEGWNMRATVYWLQDAYGPAVNDIHRALALEPRHFGALSLLGRIFVETGNKQTAVKVFEEALKINPYLDEAQEQIDELRDQVAGVPI